MADEKVYDSMVEALKRRRWEPAEDKSYAEEQLAYCEAAKKIEKDIACDRICLKCGKTIFSAWDECWDCTNVHIPAGAIEVDSVNHPEHYTQGKIEVFDALDDWSEAGMISYCISNVIKYLTRYQLKGNPLQDLKKARWYLNREIEKYEKSDPRKDSTSGR